MLHVMKDSPFIYDTSSYRKSFILKIMIFETMFHIFVSHNQSQHKVIIIFSACYNIVVSLMSICRRINYWLKLYIHQNFKNYISFSSGFQFPLLFSFYKMPMHIGPINLHGSPNLLKKCPSFKELPAQSYTNLREK